MAREGRRWRADQDWVPLYLVSLLLVALLLAIAGVGQATKPSGDRPRPWSLTTSPSPHPQLDPPSPPSTPTSTPATPTPSADPSALPGGATRIFGPGRILVAYYGTAGTGSLGVLGEASPDAIMPRLARAAREFAVGGRTVQPVFELIVRVARGGPTATGTYSADISADKLEVFSIGESEFTATELLVERYAFDSRLRALDALQLAVALELRNQKLVDHFVVADGILCEVARREGFSLINPEHS